MALGAPSVMTFGTTEMLVWRADSLDTPHMVRMLGIFYNLQKTKQFCLVCIAACSICIKVLLKMNLHLSEA